MSARGDAGADADRAGRRPVWAEIDLAALRHNAGVLRALCAPAALCAVVKADAYGHGAVPVARAALEGGATWLGVAMVEEGVELRDAGISAPVLVLSEPPLEAMGEVVARELTPTLYTGAGVKAAADAAARAGRVTDVHIKVDTGMHRVGAPPEEVPATVAAVLGEPSLRFAALWTHFPVADGVTDEDRAYTEGQLEGLRAVEETLRAVGVAVPMRHAANSAGAIAYPRARLDMVRCGISLYGVLPHPDLAPAWEAARAAAGVGALRPVLSLRGRVSFVQRLAAGERPSYGRRHPLAVASTVATVPIGYADGVPRRYFSQGGTVLVSGRRRPLAGMVTMDQIVVDCGPDGDVSVGDDVVLVGRQGATALGAWDWAAVLDTIANEIFCDIGRRVPRA